MASGGVTLTAAGYGTRKMKVERIAFGMEIIASESTARHHRALYTTRRIPAGFSILVVCTSEAEYEDFTSWLMGYGRAISGPDPKVSQVMRVISPDRGFDLSGVPATIIPFGVSVGEFVWRVPVTFLGTHSPTEPAPATSAMLPIASAEAAEALYYYPGGIQLKGTERGQDSYAYEQMSNDIDRIISGAG